MGATWAMVGGRCWGGTKVDVVSRSVSGRGYAGSTFGWGRHGVESIGEATKINIGRSLASGTE